MFSSSSQSARLTNQDGSTNVYCWSCQQFIARTFVRMNRSLCELCRRTLEGEVLTEQAIRDYEMSKLGKTDVSLVELPIETPGPARKFSLRSMTGEFTRAFTFLKKPKPEATKSKAAARSKRRPPLFSDLQLGSMTELDEKLKDPR